MPSDQTSFSNQKAAFSLLREEAIDAHLKEDGLTVGLLCATASESLENLLNEQKLELSLKDVAWVSVFQLYWMLDFHSADFTTETIHKVPLVDSDDEAIKAVLDVHWYLISEPISGWSPAQAKLNPLNLAFFSRYDSENVPREYQELFAHLIELVWFRIAGSQQWIDFLGEWKGKAAEWIVALTSELEKRLYWQTRLITPTELFPVVPESEIDRLKDCSKFAPLWLSNLHGRGSDVVSRVKQLSVKLPVNAYERRILLDFWHVNRWFFKGVSQGLSIQEKDASQNKVSGENSSVTSSDEFQYPVTHDPKEESQMRWLARRRHVSAALPLLQFHDRRELEIERELSVLYRLQSESNAFNRFEAMRLAMLHELAAMRIWDYGMWRDAEKAQSDVWLDAAVWMQNQAGSAVHGLILGSRALSLKISKSDYLTDAAVNRLEFASAELISTLSKSLLTAYPLAKFSASGLIEEIADLFPQPLWPALAEWTVIASKELDEHRSMGQKTAFGIFWSKLLPDIDLASSIWMTLLPETLKIAVIPYCWAGKYGNFLHLWMKHAPRELSDQVAQAILGVVTLPDQNLFSLYRVELLAEVEQARPEFGQSLTVQLPSPAPTQEERLVRAEHLKLESYSSEMETARKFFAGKLDERIDKMIPKEGEVPSGPPFERLGIPRIKTWLPENRQLLEKLLSAIQNPRVIRKYIPEMLNAVQCMVAFGPTDFRELARPYVASWTKAVPVGVGPSEDHSGPFSGYHITEAGLNQAREQLGWIIFQYVQLEGASAKDLVDSFCEYTLRNLWRDPVGILVRCLVAVACKVPSAEGKQEIWAIRNLLDFLRAQYEKDKTTGSDIADVLSFLIGLFGPSRDKLVDWNKPQGQAALEELVRVLEIELEPLAGMPSVRVRENVARSLVNLSSWHTLPIGLSNLLAKLSTDNRASVRRAAKSLSI